MGIMQGVDGVQQQSVRYLGALARAAASAGKREEARELYERVAELLKQAK